MDFDLSDFHDRHRSQIIEQWVALLSAEAGEQYAQRPRQELIGTVTQAFDAFHQVLVHDNYELIDDFINKITKMRLKAGFLLSDVQKAFELYRSVVIQLLAGETDIDSFCNISLKINECMSYTIHRFSDHFQAMHEEEILLQNQRLEREVRARTAELKQSELKYKTLVEEINDGYFVIQDEVIVFTNQAFCQMHGFTVEEVIGRKFQDFVDPSDVSEAERIYSKGLHAKKPFRVFEYMRLTKDGKSFPTEILAKITQYDQRLSSIGICRDITARVEMEKRIREAERMAYIGEITTSLSHEIRNPLSAVKLNLQILKKKAHLTGNDGRRIDIAINQVIRLERILRELLDFAKPLQLHWGRHRLSHIIASTLELLEMKFKEKQLNIVFAVSEKIPTLHTDKDKLRQALINLLLNAVDASTPGGTIEVKGRMYNGAKPCVEIQVTDEGSGLRDDQLKDIFKPFFTTKSKGTGLGLSIVQRIAEAHGGSLEAVNRAIGGAVFKLFLPVK